MERADKQRCFSSKESISAQKKRKQDEPHAKPLKESKAIGKNGDEPVSAAGAPQPQVLEVDLSEVTLPPDVSAKAVRKKVRKLLADISKSSEDLRGVVPNRNLDTRKGLVNRIAAEVVVRQLQKKREDTGLTTIEEHFITMWKGQ